MRVKALKGFVATIDGTKYRVQEGDELTLPEGADWLQAGLVAAVKAEAETATVKAPETAVKKTASPRKRKTSQ